jgi:hypothetical protein
MPTRPREETSRRRVCRDEGGPPRAATPRPFAWEDRVAALFAVAALIQCVRARGNSIACAMATLALPAVWAMTSRPYRLRILRAARGLWAGLGDVATGGGRPGLAAAVFVVLPAFLLYLSNGRTTVCGDSWPVVPTAISLLTEGDADLGEFCRDGPWSKQIDRPGGLAYFVQRRGECLYSSYPAGMVPFAVPVVGLSRLAGGRLGDLIAHPRLEKLTAAAVAAGALGLFFVLALHLAPPGPALAATATLGVASGMFSTVAQSLWQHDGAILWSLVVLLVEFRPAGRGGWMLQGLACAMMLACRLTAVAFLAPFGAWVLLRSPRRAAAIGCVAALAYLPWAGFYLAVYGSPLGPSTGQMAGMLWSAEVAAPLAGVLFSPGRGLVTYQPWVVLAPLALVPAVRDAAARRGCGDGPAGWAACCAAAIVGQVAIVSAWRCWWGGWCWGSRLVVEAVPLCALLCVRPIAVLWATGRGRLLVLSLAMLGALVQVPGVYDDPDRWNAAHAGGHARAVWSWSRAPFLAPFTLCDPPRSRPAGPSRRDAEAGLSRPWPGPGPWSPWRRR